MVDTYDVAIVGTGPAGIFAALEFMRQKSPPRVVMFEKGPLRSYGDRNNLTCGWGGSGAYSDGKLDLTYKIGGDLIEKGFLTAAEFEGLMRYVEQVYVDYCGDRETVIEVDDNPEVERIKLLCAKHGMELIPFPVRHLGTDRAFSIVMKMYEDLKNAGVEIQIETEVVGIDVCEEGFDLRLENRNQGLISEMEVVSAKKIIVCPGREGSRWFSEQAKSLGLTVHKNRVDIGVRVEVPAKILKHLTDVLHEPKIVFKTQDFKDRVRTFCVCPNGFVKKELYRDIGVFTVNGDSESKEGRQSSSTNFALLVSQAFTSPFKDPADYAAHVAKLANLLAGGSGVLVQRLGDVRNFQRSTPERIQESIDHGFIEQTLLEAVPGDLTLVIPARHWHNILKMLEALDWVAPGVASPHTRLYGAEVKFYSTRIEAKKGFETELPGLYVAGDGSGYTRGLLQSSIQGVMVARHIISKL